MHVVITGANRGIGARLAADYADAGHHVTATSRDGSTGSRLDVTDRVSHQDFAAQVTEPVDLLICNAGVYLDKGQSLDAGYAPALWADSFAANVTGVFLTIQTMLPQIRAAGGKIAIISSQMGSDTRAPGGSYIYRASKAAVLNLGRNLASDLASESIPVGIYHPGWVRTDMGSAAAEISVEESSSGLMARFAALSPDTTGCFETWDGRAHPF